MGQRDVFADRLARSLRVASQAGAQYAHVREAADANIAAAARSRGSAASVVGKEFSMALFDIGVPVPARSEHELEIAFEVIVRVVAPARDERLDEHFAELEVQRVFPGPKELMIVDAGLSPVSSLFVQDFAAGVERDVSGALKNAVGMRVSRRQIVANNAIVAAQRGSVVIPVDGHRERVSNKGAPHDSRALRLGNSVGRGHIWTSFRTMLLEGPCSGQFSGNMPLGEESRKSRFRSRGKQSCGRGLSRLPLG